MRFSLWFILIVCLFCGCNNAEPITYYLPKNFEGFFAVVYSQNQGSESPMNGRRQFYIPDNGILITKAKFSDGWRNDLFLLKTNTGYDTLKMYMPGKSVIAKDFENNNDYTTDSNKVAVNHREIANPTYNIFDKNQNQVGSCSFEIELITIGKASTLQDSIGQEFKKYLENYLKENYCK